MSRREYREQEPDEEFALNERDDVPDASEDDWAGSDAPEQQVPTDQRETADHSDEGGAKELPEGSPADWVGEPEATALDDRSQDMAEGVAYSVEERQTDSSDASEPLDAEAEQAPSADSSHAGARANTAGQEKSEYHEASADNHRVAVSPDVELTAPTKAHERDGERDISDNAEPDRPREYVDDTRADAEDREQTGQRGTTFDSDADAAADGRIDSRDAAARQEASSIEGEPQPREAPDGRDVTPVSDDVPSQGQSADSDLDDASQGSDVDEAGSHEVREAEEAQPESSDWPGADQKPPVEDSAAIDDGGRKVPPSTDRFAVDETGSTDGEIRGDREESDLGTEAADNRSREYLDAAGIPEGWEIVPLSRIDVSDSSVDGPENFGKGYSPEDLKWAFQALHEVVLPRLAEGRGPEYFAELDSAEGRVGTQSYSDTYHGFFKDFKGDPSSAISLDARPDGTYEVNNGYHRIWVAQQMRLSGVPAFVSRRSARSR